MVDVSLHATADISKAVLHNNWEPGRGLAIEMTMPFYAGFIEFGGTFHQYSGRRDLPGFGALWIQAGWGLQYTWRSRVSFSSSAHLGNYRMSFDDPLNPYEGTLTESELVLSASGRLSVRIYGPLSLYGRADRLYVQTYPSINLWYASAGLSVRLSAGQRWIDFFN